MFIIDPAPEFSGDVEITRIGHDTPALLRCTFRHRTVSQLRELERRMAADGLTDFQVLQDVLVRWEVQRKDGTDVPFDEAGFAELADHYPQAGPDIYRGFVDALRRGRLGN